VYPCPTDGVIDALSPLFLSIFAGKDCSAPQRLPPSPHVFLRSGFLFLIFSQQDYCFFLCFSIFAADVRCRNPFLPLFAISFFNFQGNCHCFFLYFFISSIFLLGYRYAQVFPLLAGIALTFSSPSCVDAASRLFSLMVCLRILSRLEEEDSLTL